MLGRPYNPKTVLRLVHVVLDEKSKEDSRNEEGFLYIAQSTRCSFVVKASASSNVSLDVFSPRFSESVGLTGPTGARGRLQARSVGRVRRSMHPSSGTPNPCEAYGMQGRVASSFPVPGSVFIIVVPSGWLGPPSGVARLSLGSFLIISSSLKWQILIVVFGPIDPGLRPLQAANGSL